MELLPGLRPQELLIVLLYGVVPWVIGAAIFLVALYFVIKKAIENARPKH